jgi:HEPN domain-containing protein
MTSQPWFDQAERDLEVARHLAMHEYHEWACFVAQQSAEKAVKAVRLLLGTSIDTIKKHEMSELLAEIPALHPRPDPQLKKADILDAHVQGARYPGYRGRGPDAPCKTYQSADSTGAIAIAEAILAFCKPLHAQIQTFWKNL